MSTTKHATRKTNGEASRRKFVEPTVVRHAGLTRVTAQGGGGEPVVASGEPVAFSAPAIGTQSS